jgi:hypothetical protein
MVGSNDVGCGGPEGQRARRKWRAIGEGGGEGHL